MHQIDPNRIERLIEYEREFGVTIHRTLSIEQQIHQGIAPAMNPTDIEAALSHR